MPTCENCNQKWSYGYTFKMLFRFASGMKCSHCGAAQFSTPRSRKNGSIIALVALPVLIFSPNLFDMSAFSTFWLAGGLFFLITIFLPFTIKLTDENKQLW